MPLKIIDYGSAQYQQMIDLRNEILRKPLGLLLTANETSDDKNNILIGAFEDDKMLGCCMLVKESAGCILLRQMAVRNQLQGKGVGRALMEFAENIARDIGYEKIAMHARTSATGFYEKMGYMPEGNEFTKLALPHVLMTKRI